MDPRAGASRTAFGRIWPNATTTATSAPSSRSRGAHSGSRRRAGWRTGTPAASRDPRGRAARAARLEPHPGGARHRREDAGDREAALFRCRLAALLDDHGVDERPHALAVLVAHDDEPERDADLRRGEADADLVVHRLGHVGDRLPDLGRDLLDRQRAPPEGRVAVLADLQNGHSSGSTSTSMIPRRRAPPSPKEARGPS